MKKNSIIFVLIIVIIAVGGVFVLTKKNTNQSNKVNTGTNSSQNNTPGTTSPVGSETATTADKNGEKTITYTDNGFSPSTITVKSGTTITIVNNSSHILQFDSDPHPEHTDNVELNVNIVSKGQSKTFTVTRTGSFGYHNHLNDDDRGTIVVE